MKFTEHRGRRVVNSVKRPKGTTPRIRYRRDEGGSGTCQARGRRDEKRRVRVVKYVIQAGTTRTNVVRT